MLLSGSGSYRPSSYESVVGGWQQSSMQSLLDYAAMNNARAQAAARQAMAYSMGGTPDEQNRALFNSRQGAAYRYASQFTEGLYGRGSYVDMMAGYMNITQNAGMYGSSFGRQSTMMYGQGPVTDVLAKRMFDQANKYFTDPVTGRNNLSNTQGLSITELSNIQQVMAGEGLFAGKDMVSVNRADLRTRITRGAKDLLAAGNTSGYNDLRSVLTNTSITNDSQLTSALNDLKGKGSTSGMTKGVIDSALKTDFVQDINETAMDAQLKDTTKMAKVLNKLRNVYGDVAETDLFKASQIFSGSKDPNKLLADMQAFERMARVNGLGNNLEGAARQQAGVASAMSAIFGSTQAGGLMATDVHNNILVQQRLKLTGQTHLTNEQVKSSVEEDIAGTAAEANMQDAVRLAVIAEQSGDPEKIRAAREGLAKMKGNLDPGAQSEILAGMRGTVGDRVVNLSYQEQMAYLADKGLGQSIKNVLVDTADRSKLRIYEENAASQGLEGENRATYLGMVEGLGTKRLSDVLKSGALSEEDIKVLKARGIDTDAAGRMLKDKTVRENMTVATEQTKAKGEATMMQGDVAKQEARVLASKEAYKSMLFGDEYGDPLKGSSIIELGLGLLADPNKQITDKDVRDYQLARTRTEGGMFSASADGKLQMTEEQIAKMVSMNPDIKAEDLRKFIGSDTGLADFQTYMTERGYELAVDKNKGLALTKEEMDQTREGIIHEGKKQALKNLGLEDVSNASSPEEQKKKAQEMLKKFGGTEGFADYLMFAAAKDDSPEGVEKRKAGAAQLRELLKFSGDDKGLEELGDKILTSDDDKYKNLRESLGFGGMSEAVRKEMAKDDKKGRQLAGFALAQAGQYAATPEQEALVEHLRAGGGGNQRVAYMHVEHMHVENK